MEDVYEVLPIGIESLDNPSAWGGTTIEPESIDSIVTVLSLCSILEQEKNIKVLYGLLKPGGRWYVYEHVRIRQPGISGFLLGLYQGELCRSLTRAGQLNDLAYVNLFWSFFLRSCRLRHDTGIHLRNAGPWTDIDLVQPLDEPVYKLLPHVIGVLTK